MPSAWIQESKLFNQPFRVVTIPIKNKTKQNRKNDLGDLKRQQNFKNKKALCKHFPGSSVVKTSPSSAGRAGLISFGS